MPWAGKLVISLFDISKSKRIEYLVKYKYEITQQMEIIWQFLRYVDIMADEECSLLNVMAVFIDEKKISKLLFFS